MNRLRFMVVCTLSITSLALAQQNNSNVSRMDGDGVATAPEQLRRVAPPAADLSAEMLETRADILRAQKAFADSLDYYHEAMKKKPTAVLYNKAGIAELQMLRYDEAKKDFERATKLDHTYAEPFNNLGVVYYIKRNYRKAVKYYEQAIKQDPETGSFHSNLGTALFSRKEFDRATQEYMRALELDPEIFERHSNAGVSAHMSSPEDRAHYSYVVAKMFASRGDTDHCLLYLKKAIEEGYPVASKFYADSEFDKVKKDPRIVSLVSSKPTPLPN
jgi:tetratricopeptide (TPR) repeat protein